MLAQMLDSMAIRDAVFERAAAAVGAAPRAEGVRDRLYRALRTEGWAPKTRQWRGSALVVPSDHELLTAFVDGEGQAFEQLFTAYSPELLRYAHGLLPAAYADDVVQDAFLVLFRRADHVLGTGRPVRGFLRRTVEVLARARWRKIGREPTIEEVEFAEDEAVDLFEGLVRKQSVERIADALVATCNLDEQDVVVLTLRDQEPAAIAKELGLTANHVRVLKHRAIKKLASALGEAVDG